MRGSRRVLEVGSRYERRTGILERYIKGEGSDLDRFTFAKEAAMIIFEEL